MMACKLTNNSIPAGLPSNGMGESFTEIPTFPPLASSEANCPKAVLAIGKLEYTVGAIRKTMIKAFKRQFYSPIIFSVCL